MRIKPEDIAKIISRLQAGEVAVLPTDTIYGLVARAQDVAAAHRVYEVKHREHKPGTIVAASIEQLVKLGIPRRYITPVASYWPDSISVVVPAGPSLEYLHLGKQSLAVRIPNYPFLQEILQQTGPLLTTSANTPGRPHATTIDEAEAYFGDSVDFYVDAGTLKNSKPSTVVRVVDDAVEVLRHGAVTIKA